MGASNQLGSFTMLPRIYRFAVLFLCLCAFALCSCDKQPAPQAQPRQSTEPITEDMGKHFEQVSSIQKAVIRGDLDDVSGAANWMAANHSLLGAPEGWVLLHGCRSWVREDSLQPTRSTLFPTCSDIIGPSSRCGLESSIPRKSRGTKVLKLSRSSHSNLRR